MNDRIRTRAWEWLDAWMHDVAMEGQDIEPEQYVEQYLSAFSTARRECAIEGVIL